jgi:hypothetical protein
MGSLRSLRSQKTVFHSIPLSGRVTYKDLPSIFRGHPRFQLNFEETSLIKFLIEPGIIPWVSKHKISARVYKIEPLNEITELYCLVSENFVSNDIEIIAQMMNKIKREIALDPFLWKERLDFPQSWKIISPHLSVDSLIDAHRTLRKL